MKPYQTIAIADCGEPLLPIPADRFALEIPHPYEKLGAPYGDKSPFYLRAGVLAALITAQEILQQTQPNWRLQIFDAYRPIAVQQFMVDYALHEQVQQAGLDMATLTPEQRQQFLTQVYEFWAVPNPDPATPPPHSTGAAVDLTLVDADGTAIAMGSPIDEISPRSFPDYFGNSKHPIEQQYHQHRQLLATAMQQAGFQRHPNEWWHFSLGDQLWVWLTQRTQPELQPVARYGRVI